MSEYWITDSGIVYCDGDAGIDVPNHTCVVVSECCRMLCDAMEYSDEPAVNELASHIRQVLDDCDCYIVDQGVLSETITNEADELQRRGLLSDEDVDDIFDFIGKNVELEQWIVDIGLGSGSYDERAFAIEKWGWMRLVCTRQDVTVQMHQLTPDNLKRAYSDMYQEVGERVDKMLWNLEWSDACVFGAKAHLIESGNVKAITSQLRHQKEPA